MPYSVWLLPYFLMHMVTVRTLILRTKLHLIRNNRTRHNVSLRVVDAHAISVDVCDVSFLKIQKTLRNMRKRKRV